MLPKEYSVEGKVAIVTGAGRGIGKAIALTLAEAGADITVVARTANQIEQTAEEIQKSGRKALAIPTDVTQESQIKQAVEQTVSQFGKIDILVNNAGVFLARPIVYLPEMKLPNYEMAGDDWEKQQTPEDWHRVIDTNLTSAVLFAQAVGPHMMRQKRGKIINTSSVFAEIGVPCYTAYCVSKAGLSMFTKCLAAEWMPFNICVNAVGPGDTMTEEAIPFLNDPTAMNMILDSIPARRFAEPREIALLVLYLASEASDYMTGQTVYIDGGMLARGRGVA